MHLLKGEPEEVISEVAENLDVELVVMGTVSRSGLAGFLIGNTAERILQSLDCSVLAVKPQGFVSPVTLQD
jgi:universal stress protein E